ncbi:hypothetical protein EYF80_030732 [Liparis tanakae]|uniref:Uncharacterized protein n=1 Tax=Liparis tanakae TaxID=230148 RepID=A0A4Z2GZR3_9TELE|nr:hypothetical protein EYF80_030732 [Liparis tanakae]
MIRRTEDKPRNSADEATSTSIDQTTPENSDREVRVMAAAAQEHRDGAQPLEVPNEVMHGTCLPRGISTTPPPAILCFLQFISWPHYAACRSLFSVPRSTSSILACQNNEDGIDRKGVT